jgi:RecA/RadA recombinase
MSNPLIEKLMKNTTLKDTEILSKSDVFLPKKFYDTKIPILNLALSGSVDGGLFAGVTIIAGPSKHFKSKIALTMLNGFLSDNDNGVGLVYDNEFGTPKEYFDASDIDKDRVVHSPIMNIEELKFDIIKQVSNISKRDEVAILIDSLGNMASKKELEDALKENSAMDMTRAKALKSVFRMITPYLHMRDIPLIGINHTYQTQEIYSKAVVSGGSGGYYSADNIWIIGRRQTKEGDDVIGYEFIINIEKSRFVKEKSHFPLTVTFEGGIDKWSGMLDIALELGYIAKPSNGWYQVVDQETGELLEPKRRAKDFVNNDEIWKSVMTDKFKKSLSEKYKL